MKRIYYILASVMMLMVIVTNESIAQSDTSMTGNNSVRIPKDSLANMTQAELDAYVDSIYWAGRTRPKLVWKSDTTKTDQKPPRMRTQNNPYSNSHVPNSVAINTSKAVGQIDIQSGISPTGAKTYTVPIKSYSLEGAFCPDISLIYNSQGGGSAYGKGWSIGGLQSITRVNKSIYYDNQTEGIKMNANDVFYLNGVRLIRISSSSYEYQSEQGHIKAVATVDGSVVKYFNVFYPNGYHAVFGMTYTTTNKLEYPITTLTDERGRNIYYNYISYYNTYNISSIYYDGNKASISFNYDLTRADYVQGYRGGLQLDSKYLLKTITCSRNYTTLNTYSLTYTTDGGTSLLTQLDFSANGSSLNPLIFYYGDGTAELAYNSGQATLTYYYDVADRNALIAARGRFDYNSGKEGILCYSNVNPYVHVVVDGGILNHSRNYFTNHYTDDDHCLIFSEIQEGQNNSPLSFVLGNEFITILTGDLTGNQQESVIRINNVVSGSNDVVTAQVYRKTGDSLSLQYTRTFIYSTVYTDACGNKSYKPKFYYMGDFDGNGKMELMVLTSRNPFGENGYPSTCHIYDLEGNTTLYSGTLIDFYKEYVLTGDASISNLEAENASDKVFPIDYDGDGKTDLCHINSNGMDVYTFNKSGNTLIGQLVATNTFPNKGYLQNRYYSIGEFNGDGLMDIIVSDTKNAYGSTNWYFYFSKGDGIFYGAVNVLGPNTSNYTSDYVLQDIDGDGITDLVEMKDDVFSTYLIKNNQMADGGTKTYSNSNELLVPVNINSSTLSTPLIGLVANHITLYTYMTNRRTSMALTGMANSNGVVEKNYYYQINTGDTFNIYTLGSAATFPYSKLFEAIPLLAGNELYKGGTSTDINKYYYNNAIVHRQGLGFRGFESVMQKNKRGQSSTTTYDPFNYCVVTTVDTPVSTINYINSVSTASNKILTALVTAKEDFNKLTNVTTTSSYTYDQYGQVLTENTTFTNSNITVGKAYTYTNFDNISSKYHLGRPASTTTTTTRGSSQHSEQTLYTSYNTYDEPLTIVNKINSNVVRTTNFVYDSNGNMTSQSVYPYSSSTPRTSTYQYDYYNRLTKATDPLGVWKEFTYNTDGTIASTRTYIGYTNYTYDAFGRQISETRPDTVTISTSFTWNTDNGGLYAVTKSGTNMPTETTVYDALNREVRQQQTRFNGNLLKVDKLYDTYGNLWKESYPYKTGSPTYIQYSYDSYNRLVTKSEIGKTTSYSYSGLSTTVNDGTMSTTTTTDALGGVVSVTDPAGTINYTLNGAGNPTSISAPASSGSGITTTIGYDTYGRRTSIADPSGGTTTYSYHTTEGYMQSETNAKNQTTSYVCDIHGRTTQKSSPELSTTYTYDNNLNKMTAETSSNGTSTTYSYDALGRLSSTRENAVDSKWLQKDYTYSGGRVSAIKYTSQNGVLTTENHYYTNGHLTSVKLNGTTSIFSITSENNQGRVAYMGTGGISRNYGYTVSGYPTSRAVTAFGPTKQSIQYSFNEQTGNLESRSYPLVNMTETFSYDNLNRLTSFGSHGVTYDNNGNIISKGDVGSFNYNTSGKPYAVSDVTLTNSISVGTQNVSYYSFDRPNEISDNGYTATFTYNGNYDRVKMQMLHNSSASLTRYYLGGCYELDVKPSSTTERLYLNGGYYDAPTVLIKQGNTSSVYQILRDHLGSITHVLNSSGTVVQELSYDAWGRLRNPSTFALYTPTNEPEPYLGRGYCGHEHLTGLGLINMNARLYDPLLGRFLSPDPYVQAPEHSQSFNRYSYCMNNPLVYKDEDGEFFLWTFLAATTDAISNVFKHGFNVSQYNWTKTINAWRIDMGMFKGNFGQVLNKWSWSFPLSFIGNEVAHTLNMAGRVRKVTYLDGMLALDGVTNGGQAFTIGHYSFGSKGYEASWKDHAFVHEYGHYIQGQIWGPLYINIVGIPSIISQWHLIPGEHNTRWYEIDASRRGALHFDRKYGKGNSNYNSDKPEDFFDIQSFITGDPSPYVNPRRNSNDQGYKNPISGTNVSFWDILTSLLL